MKILENNTKILSSSIFLSMKILENNTKISSFELFFVNENFRK
jgi:hypothetical protein